MVGAVTFALQLALLTLLTSASLGSVVAYAVALALAVQFNFVVNQLLVWHDRPLTLSRAHIAERWLSFHGFIALSLAVNMAGFIVAEWFVPDLAAAVIAVGASTLIKFVSLDRLVFR